MRQRFIDWSPRGEAASMVNTVNAMCQDYSRQGYDLTLRQIHYQLVTANTIANTAQSYKRLGTIVDKARLAGYLDWDYIVDRTRNIYRTDGADTSPTDAINTLADGYRRALWETQPNHVEVWVEKEALAGIVQRAAQETGVNYFACRGYVSQSTMHEAGMMFRHHARMGRKNYIIHLGDHDPSGIDMTRDIEDRLLMFCGSACPTIQRVALNYAQIEEYNPPPNFAKQTDTRFAAYEAQFGDQSWELDALNPVTLHDLITDAVIALRDEELWEDAVRVQEVEQELMRTVADSWDDVVEMVSGL